MRVNRQYVVNAGTPVNIWTGNAAADTGSVMARSVFIQMKHGGSGLGFVMGGISRVRVPSAANASDLTAEMSAATATAPGGWYTDTSEYQGIDVNSFWVDGANTGDVIIVTFDLKG